MSPDHATPPSSEPAWVQYSLALPVRGAQRRRHGGAWLALAVAAVGAVVSVGAPGVRSGSGVISAPPAPHAPAHEAAVFRYPLGCLGAAVTPGARVSRPPSIPDPCFHYGVYVTAVLERSGDIWRLGLKAISPACPAVPLPRAVRAELVACERPPRILTGF